jgi:hypothetical protein
MNTETAAPNVGEAPAVASEPQGAPAEVVEQTATEGQEAQQAPPETKEEKDPRDKMLAKERRRIANLTRRNAEMGERLRMMEEGLIRKPIDATNQGDDTDSERLTLTKAEVAELVRKEAERLAPDLSREREQGERLRKAAASVRAELGEDNFRELTEDLAGIFDQAKQMAVLRTDKPAAVIQYLTDPDNADEAERIAGMDDFDAGRALAKLEIKLATKPTKPEPSKAPAPIEAVRASGSIPSMPDPADTKAYIKWANEQDRKRK